MKIKLFTVLLLMVMAIPAFAGYDMFLTIDGIAGAPVDTTHKDWLPVTEIKDNTLKPGGTVSLVINRPSDGNSGLLYRACLMGQPNPRAMLDISKDGVLVCKIMLTSPVIAQIKPEFVKADPAPQEEVSFNFKSITWDFYGPDGKVVSHSGWDNDLKRAM
jgi:type VI protein secretion system component Hcp